MLKMGFQVFPVRLTPAREHNKRNQTGDAIRLQVQQLSPQIVYQQQEHLVSEYQEGNNIKFEND